MEITKQERKKNPKENRQSEQESQRNPELLPSRRRFLLAGGERCCALALQRDSAFSSGHPPVPLSDWTPGGQSAQHPMRRQQTAVAAVCTISRGRAVVA